MTIYIRYYKIDGFQISSNFSNLDKRYIGYSKKEAIAKYRAETSTKYKHIQIIEYHW